MILRSKTLEPDLKEEPLKLISYVKDESSELKSEADNMDSSSKSYPDNDKGPYILSLIGAPFWTMRMYQNVNPLLVSTPFIVMFSWLEVLNSFIKGVVYSLDHYLIYRNLESSKENNSDPDFLKHLESIEHSSRETRDNNNKAKDQLRERAIDLTRWTLNSDWNRFSMFLAPFLGVILSLWEKLTGYLGDNSSDIASFILNALYKFLEVLRAIFQFLWKATGYILKALWEIGRFPMKCLSLLFTKIIFFLSLIPSKFKILCYSLSSYISTKIFKAEDISHSDLMVMKKEYWKNHQVYLKDSQKLEEKMIKKQEYFVNLTRFFRVCIGKLENLILFLIVTVATALSFWIGERSINKGVDRIIHTIRSEFEHLWDLIKALIGILKGSLTRRIYEKLNKEVPYRKLRLEDLINLFDPYYNFKNSINPFNLHRHAQHIESRSNYEDIPRMKDLPSMLLSHIIRYRYSETRLYRWLRLIIRKVIDYNYSASKPYLFLMRNRIVLKSISLWCLRALLAVCLYKMLVSGDLLLKTGSQLHWYLAESDWSIFKGISSGVKTLFSKLFFNKFSLIIFSILTYKGLRNIWVGHKTNIKPLPKDMNGLVNNLSYILTYELNWLLGLLNNTAYLKRFNIKLHVEKNWIFKVFKYVFSLVNLIGLILGRSGNLVDLKELKNKKDNKIFNLNVYDIHDKAVATVKIDSDNLYNYNYLQFGLDNGLVKCWTDDPNRKLYYLGIDKEKFLELGKIISKLPDHSGRKLANYLQYIEASRSFLFVKDERRDFAANENRKREWYSKVNKEIRRVTVFFNFLLSDNKNIAQQLYLTFFKLFYNNVSSNYRSFEKSKKTILATGKVQDELPIHSSSLSIINTYASKILELVNQKALENESYEKTKINEFMALLKGPQGFLSVSFFTILIWFILNIFLNMQGFNDFPFTNLMLIVISLIMIITLLFIV